MQISTSHLFKNVNSHYLLNVFLCGQTQATKKDVKNCKEKVCNNSTITKELLYLDAVLYRMIPDNTIKLKKTNKLFLCWNSQYRLLHKLSNSDMVTQECIYNF